MNPRPILASLFRLLQAQHTTWEVSADLVTIWDKALRTFGDVEILRAGQRLLETSEHKPTLAAMIRCLHEVRAMAPDVPLIEEPKAQMDPDALLWMRYWPAPVPPGELRERHEAAFRRAGMKPYYPKESPDGAFGRTS